MLTTPTRFPFFFFLIILSSPLCVSQHFFPQILSGTKNLSLVRGTDKNVGIFKNETFGVLSETYEIRVFLSRKYRRSLSRF